jgi:hypothetical protein
MQNISTLSRKIIINELIDSFYVVLFHGCWGMKRMLHPLHRINPCLGEDPIDSRQRMLLVKYGIPTSF